MQVRVDTTVGKTENLILLRRQDPSRAQHQARVTAAPSKAFTAVPCADRAASGQSRTAINHDSQSQRS